jgi:hypothetical protein
MSDYKQEYYGKLYLYYLKLEDSGEYECETEDGRRDRIYLRVYGPEQPPVVEPPVVDPSRPDEECKFNRPISQQI